MRRAVFKSIKLEMTEKKYSNFDMAKFLGISYYSFLRKMAGEQPWKIKEIDVICSLFHKKYEELFKGEIK